ESVGAIATLELAIRPRVARAALLEDGDADHADVAITAALGSVRVLDAAEAERRDFVFAAAKAVDFDGRPRRDQVAALLERAGLSVDDIEAVDGGDGFEAGAGLVLDAQRVALAVVAHHVALAAR